MNSVQALHKYQAAFRHLARFYLHNKCYESTVSKFTHWLSDPDFEVDLMTHIAGAVKDPDEYFYVSNQKGGSTEVRVGSAGYILILFVLYCRYLLHVVSENASDLSLNHGLKLNIRKLPLTRVCLDVDIDNAKVTPSMAAETLSFCAKALLLLGKPDTRILLTRNNTVQSNQSFHLISETQFDVISAESIRNYLQHKTRHVVTIDTVNLWALPNGRFHTPTALFLPDGSRQDFTEPYLQFQDWCLMSPVDLCTMQHTISLLTETVECPSRLFCISNTDSNIRHLSCAPLYENIDCDPDDISKMVRKVDYAKLFSNCHRIDVPRSYTKDNVIQNQEFSVRIITIQQMFSYFRMVEDGLTPNTDEPKFKSDPNSDGTQLTPREFNEVLLFTDFRFRKNFTVKDVFKPREVQSEENRIKEKYAAFFRTSVPSHAVCDKIKTFFEQRFTFPFMPSDVDLLSYCYGIDPFFSTTSDDICTSVWALFKRQNAQSPLLIKSLYLYYCQKQALPVYISQEEAMQIYQQLRDEGCNPTFEPPSFFDGSIPRQSLVGINWDEITNPDTRIMLHCLQIAITNGHYFATLALIVHASVWAENIVTHAIMFLVNLFCKSRFIKPCTANVHVHSDEAHLDEAPVQLLYSYIHFVETVDETAIMAMLKRAFCFQFLPRVLLDCQGQPTLDIVELCIKLLGFALVQNDQPPAKKRKKTSNRPAAASNSAFQHVYNAILTVTNPTHVHFLVDSVACMYRVCDTFKYIYNVDRYVIDKEMNPLLCPLTQDVTEVEPLVYNFFIRREMGIYNSFLGTFDAHSPVLYSGVYINSPNFLSDTRVFNMFDPHYKNRILNILMKGVHFCQLVDYQRTALVLLGKIYEPSRLSDEVTKGDESFKYAVPSFQVCKEDFKSSLPYPKTLFRALYKKKELKELYIRFYQILCHISQYMLIEVHQPSKYVSHCLDPNSVPTFGFLFRQMMLQEDDTSEKYTSTLRELVQDSEVIKIVNELVMAETQAPVEEEKSVQVQYLHRLAPVRMGNNEKVSPYSTVIQSEIFNMDDIWYSAMDMESSPSVMKMQDIDQIVQNTIISVGGPEFELFILLLISWHIRVIHENQFSNTRYMQHIKNNRRLLYDQLQEIITDCIGPFFTSTGHNSMVEYFETFCSNTYLEVDTLQFPVPPTPGFYIPTKDYIGERPHPQDNIFYSGVVAQVVQSQFNKETMLDLQKMISDCTRPGNRARLASAFLNRPRTGKNALAAILGGIIFKSDHVNDFRFNDLQNCEHDNNGNKLFLAFNRNLVCTFDEVDSLTNAFKTVCNNSTLGGRLLFTDNNVNFSINAHPILLNNVDPICKEAAVVDRVRVFDRFYQFCSRNGATIYVRRNAEHNTSLGEISDVFAIQNLLQTLPKDELVGVEGYNVLIWQLAPVFANTMREPCSQRHTPQMAKTMSRFWHATDPAKYIIAHKIVMGAHLDPIPIQVFKGLIQNAIAQDKTIPRSTNFNLNSIIHDILDRLPSYIFVEDGVEYIHAKIV